MDKRIYLRFVNKGEFYPRLKVELETDSVSGRVYLGVIEQDILLLGGNEGLQYSRTFIDFYLYDDTKVAATTYFKNKDNFSLTKKV